MRQVVDLQAEIREFEALGVQVLAVMTDSPGDLAEEADYQGISRIPMLSDADATMSRSYDALGRGMHSDKPGHTFVLVDKDGRIRWRKDYSEMYVPVANILNAVRDALAD